MPFTTLTGLGEGWFVASTSGSSVTACLTWKLICELLQSPLVWAVKLTGDPSVTVLWFQATEVIVQGLLTGIGVGVTVGKGFAILSTLTAISEVRGEDKVKVIFPF